MQPARLQHEKVKPASRGDADDRVMFKDSTKPLEGQLLWEIDEKLRRGPGQIWDKLARDWLEKELSAPATGPTPHEGCRIQNATRAYSRGSNLFYWTLLELIATSGAS